ncbi:multivesicular body subunit 12A-like [Melanerpes formicivorus]|uniref:multivesicular body subunit 12A-like n=1 Tax=Melanerpes formicivorus TaxID=211600 RepID=UPI00358DF2C8
MAAAAAAEAPLSGVGWAAALEAVPAGWTAEPGAPAQWLRGRGGAAPQSSRKRWPMAAAAEAPLSGVGWAAALEAVPAGWTAITVTVEGAAANLGRGFGHKGGGGGGYLCVSSGGAQAPPSSVVTDVVVLSERSPQPAGYSRIPEFPEPRPGGSRKKRLYVKLLPAEAAERAVLDLKLSSKGKALPQYLRVGDLGHLGRLV